MMVFDDLALSTTRSFHIKYKESCRTCQETCMMSTKCYRRTSSKYSSKKRKYERIHHQDLSNGLEEQNELPMRHERSPKQVKKQLKFNFEQQETNPNNKSSCASTQANPLSLPQLKKQLDECIERYPDLMTTLLSLVRKHVLTKQHVIDQCKEFMHRQPHDTDTWLLRRSFPPPLPSYPF